MDKQQYVFVIKLQLWLDNLLVTMKAVWINMLLVVNYIFNFLFFIFDAADSNSQPFNYTSECLFKRCMLGLVLTLSSKMWTYCRTIGPVLQWDGSAR